MLGTNGRRELREVGESFGSMNSESSLALLDSEPRTHPKLTFYTVGEKRRTAPPGIRLDEQHVLMATVLWHHDENAVGFHVAREVVEIRARPKAIEGIVCPDFFVPGRNDQQIVRKLFR